MIMRAQAGEDAEMLQDADMHACMHVYMYRCTYILRTGRQGRYYVSIIACVDPSRHDGTDRSYVDRPDQTRQQTTQLGRGRFVSISISRP
jgi:hypothetical protein